MVDDPVPAPRMQSPHFRDPFRLLKAILIGVSLGFIAVMLRPYVQSSSDGGYRIAMPDLPKDDRKEKDRQPSPSSQGESSIPPAGQPGVQPARPKPPFARRTPPPPASVEKAPPPSSIADRDKPAGAGPVAETAPKPPAAVAPEASNRLAEEPNPGAVTQSPAAPAATPPQVAPVSTPETGPEQPPAIIPALDITYPKPFSTTEMTEAMQPLLSFKLSASDLTALKDVLATAVRGMDVHRPAIQKISDPSARKLAEWRVLRASQADFPVQLAFRASNPLFPSPILDAAAERAVFMTNIAPTDVLKFYAARRPATGPGKASLGAAYVASGERDRGARLIRQAWVRHEFDAEAETRYLALFGPLLTEDDRAARKAFLTARGLRKESALRRIGLESASAAGGRAAARVLAQRAATRAKAQPGPARTAAIRNARLPYRAVPARQINRRPLAKGGRRRVDVQTAGVSRYALIAPAAFIAETAWQWPKRRAMAAPKPVEGDAKVAPSGLAAANNGMAAVAPVTGKETGVPNLQAKPDGPAPKPEQAAQPPKPAPQSAQQKLAGQSIRLAKEIQADSATLFARLSGLKRQKANKKLWSILRSAKPETADLADPERWWELRRDEARRALNLGKPKTAYGIAKAHAPLDEEFASEAEFLSGWVALRSLKLPQLAKRHFEAARAANGSPRDQARSAYWLAQAELALKQPDGAEAHLQEAGRRWFAFYGALAISSSREGELCQFRAPAKPAPGQIAAFTSLDAAKAAMIIKQLDMQPLLTSFFLDVARQIDDQAQMTLFLELAERIAPPHVAIRFAKIAIQRGFPVEAYALPVLLPKFDIAGENGKIETAVLNALTRQESEFDVSSKSPVGARGLMQLMPGTARLVAASNKLKYELGRLSTDPSYNVTLGSSYLASLLASFDGSYVLALAAYNAGPGRVAQWMKEFGDPRTNAIDAVDWIERIPFTETRDYVQRILESTQLYRCRIEQGKVSIQLAQDLNRGRPDTKPHAAEINRSMPPQMVQ